MRQNRLNIVTSYQNIQRGSSLNGRIMENTFISPVKAVMGKTILNKAVRHLLAFHSVSIFAQQRPGV